MREITEICFVGVTRTIPKALWGWIVLNDIAVPVGHPYGAIRTNFCKNR